MKQRQARLPTTGDDGLPVQYRNIAAFPGYKIGDDGSVWSSLPAADDPKDAVGWLRRKPSSAVGGRVRTPVKGRYLRVELVKDGRRAMMSIHRLVLEAFVGPCPEGMECCHIDGDPQNNRISNLRWGTHRENVNDTRGHGTMPLGAQRSGARLTDADVIEMRRRFGRGDSIAQLAMAFRVSRTNTTRVVHGERWRHCLDAAA